MGFKASKSEIRENLYIIQEKLEVNPNELGILEQVIDNDIYGISTILQNEGRIRYLVKLIKDIELRMLKDYTTDYDTFKKYYKKSVDEWSFLNKDQYKLLSTLKKEYRKQVQLYFENRGDLMIFRKTFNQFIQSRIKNKEDLNSIKEVRNYLMNNYSYYDTLSNLGLNSDIGEDGFVKLDKLDIHEDGRIY